MLLFTLLIAVLTGILFGLAPALQVSRPDLVRDLIPVLLAGVALLASFVPARRASRVDPLVALREL